MALSLDFSPISQGLHLLIIKGNVAKAKTIVKHPNRQLKLTAKEPVIAKSFCLFCLSTYKKYVDEISSIVREFQTECVERGRKSYNFALAKIAFAFFFCSLKSTEPRFFSASRAFLSKSAAACPVKVGIVLIAIAIVF